MPSNVEQDRVGMSDAQIAAIAGQAAAAEVPAAVAAAVPPLLPIPTYRITVKGADIALAETELAGVLVDRAATLATFAFTLRSLSGLGAGLTMRVRIRKAGTGTESTVLSTPISPSTLRQTVAFPPGTTVDMGDEVILTLAGVGVIVAGLFVGYIRTA